MKKLVIIGASYLQLSLVLKAKKMDLETHVFAWEKGAVAKDVADYFYPISILDKDKILSECMKIKPDGIVSIASDIAMPTVNFIAKQLKLTGNSLQCTVNTTDKFEMRKRLSLNNIPCPNYALLKSTDDIDLVEANKLNYPLIVKPTDRSGSRGITKVNSITNLKVALERALEESFSKHVIVEEFISAKKEISMEMISWKGEHHFLAATDKVTTGAPCFVEVEQHEPANLPQDLLIEVTGLVKDALTVLGVEYGASHSEVLIDKFSNPHIVEIGARMGGDNIGACLVEMSTGYDFLKGVIEVSLGIEPQIERPLKKYAGIYYLTPKEGTVKHIEINADRFPEIKKWAVLVEPGDYVDFPVKDSAQRSGYFIYQSDNPFVVARSTDVIDIITQ